MTETIAALRDEIRAFLQAASLAYLATVEDDQPRVRPVSILWKEDRVWIGSGTSNGKTHQVRRHPRVELCVPIARADRHGYVRLCGTAEIVADARTRERIAQALPFFSEFWTGPDDPAFSLIAVVADEIHYLRPEEDHHRTMYL